MPQKSFRMDSLARFPEKRNRGSGSSFLRLERKKWIIPILPVSSNIVKDDALDMVRTSQTARMAWIVCSTSRCPHTPNLIVILSTIYGLLFISYPLRLLPGPLPGEYMMRTMQPADWESKPETRAKGRRSMTSPMHDIYQLRTGIRTKRIASYNKEGSNHDYIRVEAGETVEVAAIPGAGIIKHLWFTFNPEDPFFRRNTVIRMYWDGETHPSVESPVGDFFGQGWGESYSFVSLPLSRAEGRTRPEQLLPDAVRRRSTHNAREPIGQADQGALLLHRLRAARVHASVRRSVPRLVEPRTDRELPNSN